MGAGEQMLYRLRHHMSAGMPECMLALLIGKGQNLKRAVLLQRRAEINHFAVQFCTGGRLVQAHSKTLSDLGGADARLKLLDQTIL